MHACLLFEDFLLASARQLPDVPGAQDSLCAMMLRLLTYSITAPLGPHTELPGGPQVPPLPSPLTEYGSDLSHLSRRDGFISGCELQARFPPCSTSLRSLSRPGVPLPSYVNFNCAILFRLFPLLIDEVSEGTSNRILLSFKGEHGDTPRNTSSRQPEQRQSDKQ